MKKILMAASLLALATAASAQGVSINIGQPGFYGRIDIGNMAPPPVIYAQPVIIQRQVRVVEQPLYLRVPPGHAKHWAKHCRAYQACGRQVFFVRDDWYVNDYAPRYRADHGYREGRGHGHGRDQHHDNYRDDHRGHGDRHDNHERHDNRDNHHGKGHNKD
ncbi:MAG: hypothetical protein V4724_16205 [Pseudomonadota bacterium]